MKQKFIRPFLLTTALLISGGTMQAFAAETPIDRDAIIREMQKPDPDAPIIIEKDTVQNVKSTRSVRAINSTEALENQLLNLSAAAYNNNLVTGATVSGWTLFDTYTSSSSMTVYTFRKPLTDTTYAYTFAFRGTKETYDILQDVVQVIGNVGGLQVDDAVNYVKNMVAKQRNTMGNVYFTGHSLGGYLAAWIQSEINEGNLALGNSYTVTFNTPGLSPVILPTNHGEAVAKKIAKDKVFLYDGSIKNLMIKGDLVSTFGDSLGKVISYKARDSYWNIVEYHRLQRFFEINLY